MAKGSKKSAEKPTARGRDCKPTETEPPTPRLPTSEPASAAPLPVPVTRPHTAATQPSENISFWEKVANSQKAHGGDENKTCNLNVPSPHFGGNKEQQIPGPETSTHTMGNTIFTYERASNATLEDAGQYALNASISSGRFEDLRVLAFSGRILANRIGAPRALYANSALVTQALPSLFQDERLDEVSHAGLALCEDISVSAAYYGYSDDSDLEDALSDEAEDEAESAPADRDDQDETSGHTPLSPVAENPAGDSKLLPPMGSSSGVCPSESVASERAPSPTEADNFLSATGTPNPEPGTEPGPQIRESTVPETTQQEPRLKLPKANAPVALYRQGTDPGLRTIFVIDTAYRTWRAAVFYAYTRRVAFAPLRSQGLPFTPADDEDDPSQLPICSPKSMYRLAMKYGNAELQQLAGNDIASKLSTQNALSELFSHLTSRYPRIQDMELNFVLAHLQHPDIAVRLPAWIDRFARGELKECAETFGRLIYKLACASTTAPAGANACPRGCPLSTVQHRCCMCGLTFN